MPSNAGSPFMGARSAQPLLPTSFNLNSYSRMKSPYSLSLISHVPRGFSPCNTPFSILQTPLPGLLTSFHSPTTHPFGGPSSRNRGMEPFSAAPATTHTKNNPRETKHAFMTRFYLTGRSGESKKRRRQRPAAFEARELRGGLRAAVAPRLFLALLDRFVNFLPVHRHFGRRLDAE